jgi:hypothetical protein
MGLFNRTPRGLQETLSRLEIAVSDIHGCCGKNTEAVSKLKSDALAMRADVDLQWEKVNRAISRFAKRDAVADEKVNGSDDLNERIRRGDPIG